MPDHILATPKPRHLLILQNSHPVADTYLKQATVRGFAVHLVRGNSILEAFIQAMKKAGDLNCLQVLVEAGPTLTDVVLKAQALDEHALFRVPIASHSVL